MEGWSALKVRNVAPRGGYLRLTSEASMLVSKGTSKGLELNAFLELTKYSLRTVLRFNLTPFGNDCD